VFYPHDVKSTQVEDFDFFGLLTEYACVKKLRYVMVALASILIVGGLFSFYAKDVKGPMLLPGKADFAISRHAWPDPGFGIMAGSNSCMSGEVRR
jgi:hypothetical protein